MNINSLLILILLAISLSSQQTTNLIPYCEFKLNSLICNSFTSFEELNFTNLNQNVDLVQLEPLVPLRLDSKLNLQSLLQKNQTKRLIFKNLNGFDAFHNPFWAQTSQSSLSIEISLSKWLFGDFNCSLAHNNSRLLFESLNLDEFKIVDPESKFSLCPLIFRNTQIRKFTISSIHPIEYETPSEETNTTIRELYLLFGYSMQFTSLDKSVLNENLFKQLELIEINQCQVRSIASLEWLPNLKELRLLKFDLKRLFENGTDWMSTLNTHTPNVPFWLTFSLSQVYENEYGDDEFCFFKSFPQNSLILPLFFYEPTDFNFAQLSDILPCSCTIYWFYENNYKQLNQFLNATPSYYANYLPLYCFNFEQTLIDEQLAYCENDRRARECNQTSQVSSTTSSTLIQSECDLCECTFASLNLLECANKTLNEMPRFNSSLQFNYVSLIGSSISVLSDFKNLSLKENASLLVSNISEFGSNLFSNLNYEKQFSFHVYNSSLIISH